MTIMGFDRILVRFSVTVLATFTNINVLIYCNKLVVTITLVSINAGARTFLNRWLGIKAF